MTILLLQVSLAYADAPPHKPLKALSKKEIRIQKRLERREARKIKRRKRKIKRAKRFLNSRIGKWLLKRQLLRAEKQHKRKSDRRRKLWKASLVFLLVGLGVLLIALVVAGLPVGAGVGQYLLVGAFGILGVISLIISSFMFIVGFTV